MRSIRAEKRIWPKVLLIVIISLALAAPALAHVTSTHSLPRHAFAGGGGQMDSTGHTIVGTVGQPAVGSMAASGGHSLCSGFWCVGTATYEVCLPLVVRSLP